jgi:hypothetical protein
VLLCQRVSVPETLREGLRHVGFGVSVRPAPSPARPLVGVTASLPPCLENAYKLLEGRSDERR